jgi:endonuclease YncB( thermonuclease family)
MLGLLAGLALGAAPSLAQDSEPALLPGRVLHVIDGDTIRVQLDSGPLVVRLSSIDAPERAQPWGREAQAALASRVGGKDVSLEVVSQDRYERVVAIVYMNDVNEAESVNAWLVQQGHAWTYRRYARDEALCQWEAEARDDGLGLWKRSLDPPVPPWEWRRRAAGDAKATTDYSDETAAKCIMAMRDARRRERSIAGTGATAAKVNNGGSTMTGEPVVAEQACLKEAQRQELRLLAPGRAQATPGGYRVEMRVRGGAGESIPIVCQFWLNTGKATISP